MLKLTFSPAEARVLARERFHHPHPHVRRKMEALWLKSQGLAHQEIARLAGVSGKTLRSDLQEYVEGGVTRLKEWRFRQPQSELVAHQKAIVTYFQAHPPASINEAIDAIRELTGLSRSPTQVRLFLKEKCGMNLQTAVAGSAERRNASIGAAFRAIPGTAEQFQMGDRPSSGILRRSSNLANFDGANCRF